MAPDSDTTEFSAGELEAARDFLRKVKAEGRYCIEEWSPPGWRFVFAGDREQVARAVLHLDPATRFRISRRVLLP
jgi:hypothetical protein